MKPYWFGILTWNEAKIWKLLSNSGLMTLECHQKLVITSLSALLAPSHWMQQWWFNGNWVLHTTFCDIGFQMQKLVLHLKTVQDVGHFVRASTCQALCIDWIGLHMFNDNISQTAGVYRQHVVGWLGNQHRAAFLLGRHINTWWG